MSMQPPTRYLGLEQAREVLAEMGIELSARQIKRAADPDAEGCRKLPFFVDPVEGRLKIEKGALTAIYQQLQDEAKSKTKNRD